jgi:hypothetical protein
MDAFICVKLYEKFHSFFFEKLDLDDLEDHRLDFVSKTVLK